MAPTPPTADQVANAFARPRPDGNSLSSNDRAAGISKAPATPCRVRPANSWPRDWAAAQRTDAITSSPSPTAKTRRRPTRSARRPPMISRAPAGSVAAVNVHCSPVWDMPIERSMLGPAANTLVEFMTSTRNAIVSVAAANARRRAERSLTHHHLPSVRGAGGEGPAQGEVRTVDIGMYAPYTSAVATATETGPEPEPRDTYHHGHLRPALVQAAVDLARRDGGSAVVLREVTRRTGVTVRAAYRHFESREALVMAVQDVALGEMADVMQRIIDGAAEASDPIQQALSRLQGVGEGYITFALTEPGLFDVAFFTQTGRPALDGLADGAEPPPYRLLREALASLVAAGGLPADDMELATLSCWSAVHGFATLVTHGTLRGMSRASAAAIVPDLVGMALRGLAPRSD